jgi:Zn-dependent peptidase ImmA (M78 family)
VLYHVGGAAGEAAADEAAERMCDYFAACLLMPRSWVKRLWAAGGTQETEALAATFVVSPAAMSRRLQELGLAPSRRERWRQGPWPPAYFRKSAVTLVA